MTLTVDKLRAIINLLSDERQAGNAARILAREAQERRVLVADLIAEALAPAVKLPSPSSPAFTAADVDGPLCRRVNHEWFGLRSRVLDETMKAWLVELPDGAREWLPKSRVQHHGDDPQGRGIFIIPVWLARRIELSP
jgi:hypothetical protein